MSTENDIFDDAELEGLSPSRRKMLLRKRAKQGGGAGASAATPQPEEELVDQEASPPPEDDFDDAELEGLSPSRREMLLRKRAKQGGGAGASAAALQKTVAPKASAQKPATRAARTTTKEVDSHPFVTGTAVPEVFDIPRGTITVEPIDRRSFIPWLGIGWTAFATATGAFLTMLGRFLFPNVLFEPPQSFKAGLPSDYSIGAIDERWKEKYGVWIGRTDEYIYALSTTCTHLGCTPNWLGSESKFKCPCHGSGFRKTGINFEGPAPRPLERYRIVWADDGQILIDKEQKFQQEKGEWEKPESYLVV